MRFLYLQYHWLLVSNNFRKTLMGVFSERRLHRKTEPLQKTGNT